MKLIRTVLAAYLSALIALGPAAVARAGPEGARVQRGDVEITQTSATDWEIRASDGSIIHYDRFDIDEGQWVRFVQENSRSRVLNRVFSENPTQILGRLSANGHVYLVNPAGVVIGRDAKIDANGFHAAAGRISNADFLAGRERFTDLQGSVTNLGVISGPDVTLSDDGARVVALAGRQVTNGALGELLGKIYVDGEDGWIVLAAGTDVLITAEGDSFAVQIEGALAAPGELQLASHGTLEANRGRVALAAGDTAGLALFHTNRIVGAQIAVQGGEGSQVRVEGTLDAHSEDAAGGRIAISGSDVTVDAQLDASGKTSGGTVQIAARDGGNASLAHSEASLSVSADTKVDVSGRSGAGGSIALSTEGALDYQTTDTNLDGTEENEAGVREPGTFSLQASELIVDGTAGEGQAAVSSTVLAAQGSSGALGAKLVLEGTEALRVEGAADLSGARQSVALRGVVDTRAGSVTSAGDLSVSGSGLALGDLESRAGTISIDGTDSVALEGRLAATDQISVDAGGSTDDAQITLGAGVAFQADRVALVQDASISSSATSGVAAGDLAAIAARSSSSSLEYELRSRAGDVELASETAAAREIDLIARANGEITVADPDGILEARSADLSVDGAWTPAFGVDVEGLAALRAGVAEEGDLTLERAIRAGSITLAAGSGTKADEDSEGSKVVIGENVLPATSLESFRLEQDASIDQRTFMSGSALDVSLAADASYGLVSRLGSVNVHAGELEQVSGERVVLEARQDVNLDFGGGTRDLSVGSLELRAGNSHTVDYDVTATGSDSSIELRAGVQRDAGDDVSGDLRIAAGTELYADNITLAAGDGEPNFGAISGRVIIDPADPSVRLGRAPGEARVAPKLLILEQDEALSSKNLLTRDQLGKLSNAAGEDNITLRSRQRSVTIDSNVAGLLEGTNAVIGARTPPPGSEGDANLGVRLTANELDVKSLRVESDLIVENPDTETKHTQVDIRSAGDIELVGETPDTPGSRGNLLVRSDAKLKLNAGGDVFAGGIETTLNPDGTSAAELQLIAGGDVDVTEIVATGSASRPGADVSVDAGGKATIGSIDANAGTSDGGTVHVTAEELTLGDVLARRGDVTLTAGGITLNGSTYATRDAGQTGGTLELVGNVKLAPPFSSTTGNPAVSFTVGDMTVNGSLGVSDALQDNAGLTATVDASGNVELKQGAQMGAGSLGLAARGNVTLGGDVSADNLIELVVDSDGTGGGDLVTGEPVTLASQEIRVGAGDPDSSTSDAALDPADLANLTFAGERGAGSPLRFQLAQDRAVDLDGEGALVAASQFEGGIAGMEYTVVSRNAGAALSNAAVGGTHLTVQVAGTTGTSSSATPDVASGDISVAGGTLEVASASLVADRDLRVGFGISTTGGDDSRIELVSGQGQSGDLTVSSTLRADEIALIAGRPGQTGSEVSIAAGARFLRGGAGELAPREFTLAQESSIASLPDLATLFPALGREGMSYGLFSYSGDVAISDGARVAGTQLSIGAQDVSIQSELQVASLDVSASGTVEVDAAVTAAGNRVQASDPGTWAPSHIRLHAGAGGSARNVEIGAVGLSGEEIVLRAGGGSFDSSSRTARVTFAEGAKLGGPAGSRLARLEVEQDAAFGTSSGSAIPTAFIDSDDLAGLDLSLISNGGQIVVGSAAQTPLQGMRLALSGARGVTLENGGGLRFESLYARAGSGGSIALHDSVRTESGELNLAGNVTLAGAGDRKLSAQSGAGVRDGIVTVDGTLARSDGTAEGVVDGVVVEGADGVSIAAIDTSGTDDRRSAGSVRVSALGGLAEVGSVRAVGFAKAEDGGNGGAVEIDGPVVRVGDVDTGAEEGDAGAVHLGTGASGDLIAGTERVELQGSLRLLGEKLSEDEDALEQAANLVVNGPLALRQGGGQIDAGAVDLRGGVRLAGGGGVIGTGTEALRANARGTLVASGDLIASEVALTGLGAAGEIDLRSVGNVLGDRISLEAGEGGGRILLPTGIRFRNLDGEDHPDAFRIAQDAALDFGGGANQLVTRDNLVDAGGDLAGLDLALESRSAQVHVYDTAELDGTLLSLSGAEVGGAAAVQVDGNLDVARLTLGAGAARISGDLSVEGNLTASGDVRVDGTRAHLGGQAVLDADRDQQTLSVAGGAGTLELGGDLLRQRSDGRADLVLEASAIELATSRDQRIAAHGGVAEDAPRGTLPEATLAIRSAAPLVKANGALTLEADSGIDLSSIMAGGNAVETRDGALSLRTREGSTLLRGDLSANGGDLLADTRLDFGAAPRDVALRSSDQVSVLQGANVTGDLAIEAGDGEIHTGGDLDVAGDFLPDSDLVIERDTTIVADRMELTGTTGARRLELGIRDPAEAGHRVIVAGATPELEAGSLVTRRGTEIVATGDLALSAPGAIRLGGDVAASSVVLRSDHIAMSSGASVLANRITATSAPSSGTFATPTGNEVSDGLVSRRVVRRTLFDDGRTLTLADLEGFDANGVPAPEGPALFDATPEATVWRTAPGVLAAAPRGLAARAALTERPLWADEVLAFLREDPKGRGLPSVAAGDRLSAPLHERLRSPDAERAAALYGEIFRPARAGDPDAVIERRAELRALFAAAAEGAVDARTLLSQIASDPAHAEARAVVAQLSELLVYLRRLGLPEADYTRVRRLVAAPLVPEGVDPDAFAEALEARR
jgi:filamentous hemagglutinin family protein